VAGAACVNGRLRGLLEEGVFVGPRSVVKQLYDGPRLAGLDGFHLEATQLLLRLGHLREQASQMLGNVIQQPVE
jgi:hypothetical protein